MVYQSCCLEDGARSSDRRRTEQLRQARRAPATYGSNVNRRLRGRWFSLVPVRRRAMVAVGMAVAAPVGLLCLFHGLALFWQPLTELPEVARPLRLDRPDGLGAWFRSLLLALAAGASLLIYQLRRHRNDDFRGSYRIWPPVIALMGIGSLDAVANLVPWVGAIIEWCAGRRVALSGADWIRIILTVGGAALALRMVAEVRSSRLATAFMVAAILAFATPLAAHWGVLASDTAGRWLLVTSAPLLSSGLLALACVAYLRKLFREVRKLDDEDPISQRWRQWTASWGAWWQPSRLEQAAPAAEPPSPPAKPRRKSAKESPAATEPPPVVKRSRWWSPWRRAEPSESAVPAKAIPAQPSAQTPPSKPDDQAVKSTAEATKPAADTEPAAPPKRGWLSRLVGGLRRSPVSPPSGESQTKPNGKADGNRPATLAHPTGPSRSAVNPNASDAFAEDDSDEATEDDSVDMSRLSKAERRRLRREGRRGGHAA